MQIHRSTILHCIARTVCVLSESGLNPITVVIFVWLFSTVSYQMCLTAMLSTALHCIASALSECESGLNPITVYHCNHPRPPLRGRQIVAEKCAKHMCARMCVCVCVNVCVCVCVCVCLCTVTCHSVLHFQNCIVAPLCIVWHSWYYCTAARGWRMRCV